MSGFKALLRGFSSIVFTTITIALALVTALGAFALLVYPTNVYLAVVIALLTAFAMVYVLNRLRRKVLGYPRTRIPVNAIVTTAVLAVLMIAVFWIPSKTFASVGAIVDTYGSDYQLIAGPTGDKIAVYEQKPEHPNGQAPVLWINGGPGAAASSATRTFLTEYVRLGYTVYVWDPIGTGNSPLPTSGTAYSIDNDVKTVDAVLDHFEIDRINLIAHSYGGTVAPRFIAEQPNRVAAFLNIDTAPLYSLGENYPGEDDDKAYQAAVEPTRSEPTTEKPEQSIFQFLDLRDIARFGSGLALKEITGNPDYPYGDPLEYDYGMTVAINAQTGAVPENGKLTERLNIAADVINDTLRASPDYTMTLPTVNTPPVLVVHPEYGVVPWQSHYSYRDYFQNVQYVTAPGAGHGVWKTATGLERLLADGDAFFKGEAVPDAYTSPANPFPPS